MKLEATGLEMWCGVKRHHHGWNKPSGDEGLWAELVGPLHSEFQGIKMLGGELANFCKGPDSTYFRLSRPYGL